MFSDKITGFMNACSISLGPVPTFQLVGNLTADAEGAAPSADAVAHGRARDAVFVPHACPQARGGHTRADEGAEAAATTTAVQAGGAEAHLAREAEGPHQTWKKEPKNQVFFLFFSNLYFFQIIMYYSLQFEIWPRHPNVPLMKLPRPLPSPVPSPWPILFSTFLSGN